MLQIQTGQFVGNKLHTASYSVYILLLLLHILTYYILQQYALKVSNNSSNIETIPTYFILHAVHVQSWPKILALLVNMIKEGCENVSALLILLIFCLKYSQKSNLSLDNKNLKWGGGNIIMK